MRLRVEARRPAGEEVVGRAGQGNTRELGAAQVGPPEEGAAEIGAREVCPAHVSTVESAVAEVGARKLRALPITPENLAVAGRVMTLGRRVRDLGATAADRF